MFCLGCQTEKDASAFYVHVRTGPSDICKKCQATSNALRKSDPDVYEALKALRKQRRKARQLENTAPFEKICTCCGASKALTDFRERSRGLYGRTSECRACELGKGVLYRQENRVSINQRKRVSWSEKEFAPEERQVAREKAKKWHSENKDRHNEYGRKYAAEHREEAVARATAWKKANPDKVRAISNRHRFQKQGSPSPLSSNEWLEILEYFNHSCAYCLVSSVPMTMDHLMPLSKGGHHSKDNVVPACRSCNCSKSNRPIWVMADR